MSDLSRLSPSLARRLEAELRPGERLIYAGKPTPWRSALSTMQLNAVVFGSIFCAITGKSLVDLISPAAAGDSDVLLHLIVTVFFFGIGLTMLASPPYAVLKAIGTVHAVTSERLLTLRGAPFRSVESRPAREILSTERRDYSRGFGTLVLHLGVTRDSKGDVHEIVDHWFGIPDVRRAEQAVYQLMQAGGRHEQRMSRRSGAPRS